jgi:carbamoyl-phosphate synthase small subunit
MKKIKTAHLVLSDGTVFTGYGFGYDATQSGEVVFNTSLTGYQEILTDPSYAGQIICMTYPHIGNYGMNPDDVESKKIFASGLIVKEASGLFSNYRAKNSLDDYLKKEKIPGIAGIDTRALVRHIRDNGAMPAIISIGDKPGLAALKTQAKKLPSMEGQNLAKEVSCKKPYTVTKGVEDFVKTRQVTVEKKSKAKKQKAKYKVIAYDFGVKKNILRLLVDHGCEVTVVPYDYPAEDVLAAKVDGVFLSNGPGDPAPCVEAIANVKKIIGKKPVFGICLGHQILSLALGAKTFKLKFGHHGGNQPVMELGNKKVEITAQNHGFAVDPMSLPDDLEVTHMHLNDDTVSGVAHKSLPVFSVQYHPEAAPGPHDSAYLFQRFIDMMESHG